MPRRAHAPVLAAIATLIAGCTVGPTPDDLDEEADADDPAEIDTIESLIVSDASEGSGAPITLAEAATADRDGDGIADAIEERLLRRYRPYYRFSRSDGNDEAFRPANAVNVMSQSQLVRLNDDGDGTSGPIAGCGRASDAHLDPPETVYDCAPNTDLNVSGDKTRFALNIANATYHGAELAAAEREATGLYGHVAPTRIGGHDAYKIEYWQFFAFNNQDITVLFDDSFGDHEGDWTSVQLWLDRELHRIVRVRYLIHGKEVLFDLPAVTPHCTNCMLELRGANFDPDPPNFFSDKAAYSNNAAQFYVDANKFKHVVVYIERGGHEFWPGPWGHAAIEKVGLTFNLNPHHGDGPSYLVPSVTDRLFNLGEVDAPLTRAGRIVLPFSGFWGNTNSHLVGPWGPVMRSPVGPALHCSWRFPSGQPLAGCEN